MVIIIKIISIKKSKNFFYNIKIKLPHNINIKKFQNELKLNKKLNFHLSSVTTQGYDKKKYKILVTILCFCG